jgi:Zn finger protein HypA/HybF involved in hydrogenase expression
MTARKSRTILVRALLEIERSYVCVDCGRKDQWYGKKLFLEVDHIDGDWKNNIPENLRFLCPNCHSIYTRAQRVSNKQRAVRKERIKKPDPTCVKCGGRATRQSKSGVCRHCFARKEKIDWPPLEELEAMVKASNRLQVAKQLGVSWNSVDNHLNQR